MSGEGWKVCLTLCRFLSEVSKPHDFLFWPMTSASYRTGVSTCGDHISRRTTVMQMSTRARSSQTTRKHRTRFVKHENPPVALFKHLINKPPSITSLAANTSQSKTLYYNAPTCKSMRPGLPGIWFVCAACGHVLPAQSPWPAQLSFPFHPRRR